MPRWTQQQRDEWLSEFQAIAADWGSLCLSAEYLGQRTKLDFQCAEGHQWSALPMNVYHKGSWCPHCNGNAKLNIEDADEAAAVLGGKCLSTEYISVHKPLEW